MPVNPLISVKGVSFSYSSKSFIHDISFSVQEGEMLGMIGPNGSGKSTWIKLIAGLIKPSAGIISYRGESIHGLAARERAKRMAYVPQKTAFAYPIKILDAVLMGRYAHRKLGYFDSRKDVDAARLALATTGLRDFEDRYFDEVSGGEQQRVALASAIAQDPELLLLDEPISSLDVSYQLHILEFLKRLNGSKGMTIIAALHDLNLASRFFDRLIIIDGNHEVLLGPTSEILTAEAIDRVFGVRVARLRDPGTGASFIYPLESQIGLDDHV